VGDADEELAELFSQKIRCALLPSAQEPQEFDHPFVRVRIPALKSKTDLD
jgi:hypothetical protein